MPRTRTSARLADHGDRLTRCTNVHIIIMTYEWDRDKAGANARKHGIRFSDPLTVLEDDLALTMEDDSQDERRWLTLGQDHFGRVLVVVYVWRGDEIRIISARIASPKERRRYGTGQ
jgi:uncharacterized DUF497 family protein